MGQINNLKCNSCDYTFDEKNTEFYFNDDLTKIKEDIYLFSNFQEIAKSPISGKVYISYCNNCNTFIKTYEIIKNETNLPNDEIKKIILNKEDNDFEKVIQITTNEKISCPKCDKILERQITDGSSCPKCKNGKLLCENIMMVD